jgi:hypothetical protein
MKLESEPGKGYHNPNQRIDNTAYHLNELALLNSFCIKDFDTKSQRCRHFEQIACGPERAEVGEREADAAETRSLEKCPTGNRGRDHLGLPSSAMAPLASVELSFYWPLGISRPFYCLTLS